MNVIADIDIALLQIAIRARIGIQEIMAGANKRKAAVLCAEASPRTGAACRGRDVWHQNRARCCIQRCGCEPGVPRAIAGRGTGKLALGQSMNRLVVQDETFLAQARLTEIMARSNWMKARIALTALSGICWRGKISRWTM